MADEAQHKESENHARLRMERNLMAVFGVTRSDARKALRRDAEERRAATLSVPLPGPAIGGQQQVQISETVHEIKKGGGGGGGTLDTGSTPPSSTSSVSTVRTVLLVSGIFQIWDLQGTFVADV